MNSMDKSNTFQARNSLTPNRSSISTISRNREKHSSSFRSSIPKLQRSIDTHPRSSTTRSTRTTFKVINQQYSNEKPPFSESELTHRISILTNNK